MERQAKPFVKWAGGKGQLLADIRSKYPTELGKRIDKYAEPFVGGGAVLFDVLNNYDLREVYISDVNRELIHTYTIVRDNSGELIVALADMEREYNAPNADRTTIYYNARERFNSLKLADSNGVELAALFIFINRTCFNGLYRVNRKGEYNVPQGKYAKPTICDADNLRAVSEKLQRVTAVCGDYKLSRNFIDDHTFAYFDPPYRPLTTTANFTAYAEGGFDDSEQESLAKFIDDIATKGAYFTASNSDPKNYDERDDFFDALYCQHTITRITATRAINSIGNGRGRVSELLIARG
ncbi:restriction endonuclease subunit M [Synergistales bacterium]|nr:restriction endonuclease subunit M [Synergistales bacterium]